MNYFNFIYAIFVALALTGNAHARDRVKATLAPHLPHLNFVIR